MMDKYEAQILNKLLDKYEASKTFIGDNLVKQSFAVSVAKEFPRYADDSDFDTFDEVNRSIRELVQEKFVFAKQRSNGIFTTICLNLPELDRAYGYLKREPKIEERHWLKELLQRVLESKEGNVILKDYARMQQIKMSQNKNIDFFTGDRNEIADILKAAQYSLENKEERFIRDASMELFHDSKRLEQIQSKVQTMLFRYGDFAEREYVLEELGIVRTPTYIIMKGNAIITVGNQNILLNELEGDIAFSTKTVQEISRIQVLGSKVITIENLTTFHAYRKKEDFCIYLGGFHNQLKQKVIMKLHEQNCEKNYFHFGDIDAGGFYIFEHLIRKTGINFQSMNMNVETLQKYQYAWKPLTQNDKQRLLKLRENQKFVIFYQTIDFMLKNNCKLEQEAIL